MQIILIKVSTDWQFEAHLSLFTPPQQKEILGYRQRKDQLLAFTSALLKYYYLAAYLGVKPDQLNFTRNKHGKPQLVGRFAHAHFNISHSGAYCIMAIHPQLPIGIDIEQINWQFEFNETLPISFSPSEQEIIGNDRQRFYRLWVIKEAWLKACGSGLVTSELLTSKLTAANQQSYAGYQITVSEPIPDYLCAICLKEPNCLTD